MTFLNFVLKWLWRAAPIRNTLQTVLNIENFRLWQPSPLIFGIPSRSCAIAPA